MEISNPSKRMIAARLNGRKGGLATAAKHGQAFCQARSEKAGNALRDKYGTDYYKHILQFRKKAGWPKGKARKPVMVAEDGKSPIELLASL